MSLNSIDSLGVKIGDLSFRQSNTDENISGDDTSGSYNFEFSAPILIVGTVTAISRVLPTDGFVIDHPVYGDLDNTSYPLDVDYPASSPGFFTFPATFPLTFAGGTAATGIAYTTTF